MNTGTIRLKTLRRRASRFVAYLLLPALLGVYFFTAAAANSDTQVPSVTVRADSWFPFNGAPNSEHPGYMIEIAQAAFSRAGLTLDYQLTPWSRSISLVEQGEIDGIVGTGKKETPNFIFPEEPLAVIQYSVFTLNHSPWSYSGINSLQELLIGAIADYSYAETMDAYLATQKGDTKRVHLATGDTALEQNIEMLIRGRLGAVVSNREVFFASVDKLKISRDSFREAAVMPEKDPLYIAFSPKKESSARYAKILSDGIEALRASGELKKILTWYQLNDWKSN